MFRLNGVSSSFLLQKAWRSTEAKAKVCDLTVVDRNVDLSGVKSQLTIHGEEFLNSAYHAWAVFLNSAHHPPPPPPPLPLRHKHPTKVHVWAGISLKGRCGICIFEGIMKKELYTDILDATLLPFIRDYWPEGHKFMQDNDPKHTSKHAQKWITDNNINWWKTPAESPDFHRESLARVKRIHS